MVDHFKTGTGCSGRDDVGYFDKHEGAVSSLHSAIEDAVVGTTMEGHDREFYRGAAEDIFALIALDWISISHIDLPLDP